MNHRIGVVGAGTIAKNRHIPAYLRHDSVELCGVYDRNPEVLSTIRSEFGVETFDDFDSLCEVVDTVVLCTPPWAHHEPAIEAFERGCHVFTEKPMAMSTDEADEMIAAAEEHDRKLAVVHNNLWKRAVKEAGRKIDSGNLGSVRRTYAIQLREMDDWDRHSEEWFDRLPGGLFWDEAPHMMYLTRRFLGEASVETANVDIGDSTKQTETALRARFSGESGEKGSLTMIFDAPVTEWWFVVLCSRGLVAVDIFRNSVAVLGKEDDHSALEVLTSFLSFTTQAATDIVRTGVEYLWDNKRHDYAIPDAGFSEQVTETITAFENGRDPPVSGEDGRETVAMMEDIASHASLD